MNISTPSKGVPIKRICLALAGVGFTTLLAGCGGGSSAPAVTPPPPPTVTIDVFGARGAILTAQVTSTNCSVAPTVTWQTSGGVALGTGLTIQDTQPASVITATASCSTASVVENLQPNVVFNTNAAFAVVQNGSVVAWGDPVWGGTTSDAAKLTNISKLYPSERGFAALLTDGSVSVWGSSYIDPTTATGALTNISTIIPGRVAYFGIKNDGSFVAWGNYRLINSSGSLVTMKTGLSASTLASLTNIKSISSTEGAYAALKNDGTVVAFGDPNVGGDASTVQSQLTNVVQVAGTNFEFLALTKNGNIYEWSNAYSYAYPDPSQQIPSATKLTVDGTVGVATTSTGIATAFGYSAGIDAASSASVASLLNNVTNIYATETSFAALLSNGSVVSWGDLARMGDSLNAVQSSLTNVKSISNTEYAFAALKNDGSVVTWGDPIVGGDSSAVASQLKNVVAITANKYAFAALTSSGTVVTWGMPGKGGSSSTTANLTSVRAIYATPFGGFLAVNKDGSFATWGDQWAGGGAVPNTLTKIPFAS
ncbi:hypothetical protein ACO0K7_06660 [Undibacterium sp. Ji67W]|uniref:hypothetical protein n=1 Tax=Undibacterium sp. Ji67W TaxID=3413042 RepID=UPI003BEFE2D1